MRLLGGVGAVAVLVLSLPHGADALTLYTDRASFEAQGTIVFNYGFEDFPAEDSTATPVTDAGDGRAPSWSTHGMTYRVPGSGMILGAGTWESPQTNVLASYSDPDILLAEVDPQAHYDMFAFDLGSFLTLHRQDPFYTPTITVQLSISTNLGGTIGIFDDLPYAPSAMRFFGFVGGPGEYFTGLNLYVCKYCSEYVALDNVTLGHVAAVPEPMTLLLFLAGLPAVWGIRSLNKS